MHDRVWNTWSRILALVVLASMPAAVVAQAAPAPQAAAKSTMKATPDSPSKWDIFAGYSALVPSGAVNGFHYNSIDYGTILSVTRYFTKNFGIRIEGDEHTLTPEGPPFNASQPGDDFSGVDAGLVYRIPMYSGKVTPSFHVMLGSEQVGSYAQSDVWGFSLVGGGSLDVKTPAFKRHLSIRVAQVDYQYVHAGFAAVQGGPHNFGHNGRFSAGLVWNIGSIAPPLAATISCAASPASVYPGDPVTVTAAAFNLNPKMHAVYSWSGQGVTGKDAAATVDTAGLAPGTYTVNCSVKEGKAGMEGLKPWETANGTATFNVLAYEPPTISCSANPSTIMTGGTSTITAVGVSPQNRPLTYTFTSTGGSISGNGRTATFSSAGAATGTVGVSCKVADDKGNVASSSTTVTIQAPPPPPRAAHAYAAQCSPLNFSQDIKRPTRVDNTASACLDIVARDLKSQTGLKVVVVGEETEAERRLTAKQEELARKYKHIVVIHYAAQRAVNAKDYLITHEGIEPSLITAATGTTDGLTTQIYEVPPGANFATDFPGTTPVSDSVTAQKREAVTVHRKK